MNAISQLVAPATVTPPAAGAPITQVVVATACMVGILGSIALLLMRHRAGRWTPLDWAAKTAERLLGMPYWVALPSVLVTGSLLLAVFGVYWDVSIHIDQGRDPGPLANLAHYPIMFGLIGLLAAGWLAIALPARGERPGPAAVRLAPNWYAPVGGIVITVSAAFGLVAFPLDDLWHRIFGQDVTLWGPTHLMMIGGAVTTLVGEALLLVEGARSRRSSEIRPWPPRLAAAFVWIQRILLGGALLLAVDVFAMEFNYGVPQFAALFHPMLLAFGAALGLVTVRLWAGPGGAIGATVFFLIVRWALVLIVGPILGEHTPAVPLFIAEALCVELAGLALSGRKPLTFGLVCGALIGTVGFAAEWAWSQVAMPLPWHTALLPEGLIVAIVAGLAGGVIGSLLSSGLQGQLPSIPVTRVSLGASLVAIAVMVGFGLSTSAPQGDVSVNLVQTSSSPREAIVEARFSPAALPQSNDWTQVTSWQGGGVIVTPLEQASGGVWRSAEPVPIYGQWKTVIRIADGGQMAGVPVYMPADPAIPAPAVPANSSFTRPLSPEKALLQREAKTDVPSWLWTTASSAVLALYLCFFGILAWGIGRVGRGPREAAERTPSAPKAAPAPAQ